MTMIEGNGSVAQAGGGVGGMVPMPGEGRDVPIRELLSDEVLDVLSERSRDEAGQLRLTGEGSMLGELVKAVLERALEAELTAHLGYGAPEEVLPRAA